MALTSSYQYIGRSNAVSCPAGWKYYILLYAKTSGSTTTGKHTVTVKQTLVCDQQSTFYGWSTTGSATVDGSSAFSWNRAHVPDKAWNTSNLTAGSYTYPRWIDLKEGSVVVNTGYGVTKEVTISASWVMKESNSASWFPATGTYARVSAVVTLPMISSASAISSASNVTLDNNCSVTWTPMAASFRYKLKFSMGSWSYTTGVIHPNKTTAYTYTDYKIPLVAAKQIPSDPSGTMTATLYTYSDSGATSQIGSASTKTFTVTVPNNSSTQPKVTVTLSPVSDLPSAFGGLYVSGKSKVKVSSSASSDYSTVESCETTVQGVKSTANPYTSGLLNNSGTVTVTVKVTDARGYSTTKTANIEVIPYSRPRIIPGEGQRNIVCTRCNSDGTADPGGVYLLIKVGRKYEKVVSGGSQKNYCHLSYRYKEDSESESRYSSWVTLLDKTATADYVSAVLPNIVSSNTIAYNIQFITEDDTGEKDTITITVPTAFVTFHIPEGGHGLTIGGYHNPDKEDVFDCRFDAEFNGNVSGRVIGLGELPFIPSGADVNDYLEFGVYAVTQNAKAVTITNLPVEMAGTLRVWSANGSGIAIGDYVYILQEYIVYDNSATYRRYAMLENDSWEFGAWKVTDGADVIIEHGSTDGWYWRKFANGTAECWTRVTQTVNVSTEWGVLYYGACKVVNFPFEFAYVPVCNIRAEYSAAGNPSAMMASNGRTTTTQAANVLLVRPTANSAVDCVVVYHAIGRWK